MIQEIIQSSLARELTMRTITKVTFHDRIEKGEILVKCKILLNRGRTLSLWGVFLHKDLMRALNFKLLSSKSPNNVSSSLLSFLIPLKLTELYAMWPQTPNQMKLHWSVQIWSFFWSVISRIRTEYGNLLQREPGMEPWGIPALISA